MPITLDHQMREQIPHRNATFPITYFHDELSALPNFAGPLHWHPDFEIATAGIAVLEYQVAQYHITLKPGDSIFVNGNILHGIRQAVGDVPDPMSNIVFSGSVIASENSAIYQKYILPISRCDSLPFIVFRHSDPAHDEIAHLINDTYSLLREQSGCYEMAVQRDLNRIFCYIFCHLEVFSKAGSARIQINDQIRMQKMLLYIYEHYMGSVTLEDIARAASISRSEAGRCFNTYMGCAPVEALIQYRLQIAHRLLNDKGATLEEISSFCGFNSVNYFRRQFKKKYGYTPRQSQNPGK